MPDAAQHQVPNIHRAQRTVEVWRVQFAEDVVDVPMDMASPSRTVDVAQKLSRWPGSFLMKGC